MRGRLNVVIRGHGEERIGEKGGRKGEREGEERCFLSVDFEHVETTVMPD